MGGWASGLPKATSGGGSDIINLNDVVYSEYDEALAVASGVQTVVATYVVGTKVTELMNVEFGGSNIANYKLLVNSVTKAQAYTWFNGGGLTGTWDFRALDNGLLFNEGDTIQIVVLHNRPFVGDFYGRMNFLLITPST